MRIGAIMILAAAASLAVGCDAIPKPERELLLPGFAGDPAPAESPAAALDAETAPAGAPALEERLIFQRGVRGSLSASANDDDALAGKTIRLAFVNAPAADVARTVLAEALGETLAVADGVSGVVTLSAADAIPARDALAALEAVLAESDLALMHTETGFLLAPLQDARSRPPQLSRPGAGVGYGVAFAPIRHAPASEIAALIEPFLSERLTVTADDDRGAILLRGPQSDIATAQAAIEAFDSPHLTDRTFGLFRLQYADAATLRTEIMSVIGVSGGAATAEILALPRLNLLFVATRTRAGFNETRSWIDRLDQPSGGDERRLRYYPAQNTAAERLADQLRAVFAGGASSGGFSEVRTQDTPASALQPGFRAPAANTSAGGLSIATDDINNALIIRATDQEYREIRDLLERMDVLSPQVLIEATIAEITLNESLNYGVRWFWENAESTLTMSDNEAGQVAAVFPGLNYTYVETDARVALSALSSVTDVTVLSAPSIMVLNNQTAHLQVGDEVPIVTQQAQGVIDANAPIVSNLQLRETGVILEVKPRINASGMVILEISQEVSDVTPTTTSGIDSPTIQQRRFTSTVAVRNNGTVALGGLIREVYSDNRSGVPVLKDIPLFGAAFKTRDISKRRTELVVFLTPRIIRNDDDAREAIRYIRREMTRLGVKPDS